MYFLRRRPNGAVKIAHVFDLAGCIADLFLEFSRDTGLDVFAWVDFTAWALKKCSVKDRAKVFNQHDAPVI
jgi:hypothetical protein